MKISYVVILLTVLSNTAHSESLFIADQACTLEEHNNKQDLDYIPPKIVDFEFDLHEFLESLLVNKFDSISNEVNLTNECAQKWNLLHSNLIKLRSIHSHGDSRDWPNIGFIQLLNLC